MTKKSPTTHSIGGKRGAKCSELLALLNEYVDGKADPAICKELEGHLAKCNPCRVVVDNVRKTITLYRDNEPCDLPEPFRKRLHACLREHWKKPAKAGKKQ
jgi:anti-sigma factor RsiW